jgi:hypothetical protein
MTRPIFALLTTAMDEEATLYKPARPLDAVKLSRRGCCASSVGAAGHDRHPAERRASSPLAGRHRRDTESDRDYSSSAPAPAGDPARISSALEQTQFDQNSHVGLRAGCATLPVNAL